MKQYLDLLKDILDNGAREPNRTGVDTLTVPGAMLKFDLRDGFPAVTTKKLAFKQVVGELIGFLRGCTSAADFRALGCTIWDANANENAAWLANPYRKGVDDLGKLGYSHGWRQFGHQWEDLEELEAGRPGLTFASVKVDQIKVALHEVRHNSESRRILVSAWNPTEIGQAALPPCHVLFQLLPRSDGTLHMTMYQRSCDMFLGVPFNIASYALLLELFAAWTGRTAATLTMFLADAHIYVNHIEQAFEQIGREPLPLPRIWWNSLDGPTLWQDKSLEELLESLSPDRIQLSDYQSHAAIKAPMAV